MTLHPSESYTYQVEARNDELTKLLAEAGNYLARAQEVFTAATGEVDPEVASLIERIRRAVG
jgi:uncharacterized protein YPO0396